jgi:tetratricopeptide (TPR) repeat protein
VEDIFAVDQSRTYLNRIAGYSCYEQGNYVQALSYLDRLFATLAPEQILPKDYIYYAKTLLKKNLNYPKLVTDLEKTNTEIAAIKEKNESLKGAAKEKEKVSDAPLQAKAAELQSAIALADKELAKAYEAYDKAISAKEDDMGLINEKANSLYTNQRFAEAAATWTRLLTKGKDGEDNYLLIGKAYYRGKDFDKADEILNQMITKYPDNLQGYLWSARNASAKDPDSKLGIGKQRFTALIAKASADSVKYANEIYDALRYLGYSALQSDSYESAKSYYNRMANLDPNNKDFVMKAHGSMATMYMQMGEYNKATEYYNKILALDPGNSQAKSSIQYISALLSSAKPKASPNEITGVIRDSAGQPIAGASVRVKDTAAEAWTNGKGEYKFTMPEASTMLVISAKDYKTKEITVTKARVYNATLGK